MGKESTRRVFLTAVGAAGAMTLAGCSSIPGGGNDEPADPDATDTPNTDEGTDNGGGDNGGDNGGGPPGESIDDFSSVDEWQISEGELSTTTDDVFQGDQSVVLKPSGDAGQSVVKISKTFYPDNLDLTKHDLSLAAKVKKPNLKSGDARMKVATEVIAPAESSMATAVRQFPRDLDSWVRFDIGYTDTNGTPEMGNVTDINIQIGPRQDNKQFEVLIDDLRKVPKANKGKVMFQFDDGHITTYENAFPILKERGWSASAGIIPNAVNGDNYMTEEMLREMADEGWDMVGHHGKNLTDMSPEQQAQNLQQVKRYLDVKGFGEGANHFIVPYHQVDKAALDNINELFDMAYLQGGGPNNAKNPSNPAFISRINGESIRGSRRIINMAAEFNQLAVIYFHEIGDGDGWLPTEDFEKILDHAESKEVDVITPTQLTSDE